MKEVQLSQTAQVMHSLSRALFEWQKVGGSVDDVVAEILHLIDTRIIRHGEGFASSDGPEHE